jgi:Na+/melibiose symporter-like transporter
MFVINYFGLFPDKFRNRDERITASAIGTVFTIAGVILGGLIPPLIIIFGNINSYVLMGWITVIFGLICFPFLIPGVRDDKEAAVHFVENYTKKQKEPLLQSFKTVFSQKNLSMYLILILFYYMLTNSMSASLLYYARFVMFTEADVVTIFMASMFGGALVGVIIWFLYVRKTQNNRGVMIYSGIIMVITSMIFSFLIDFYMLIIVLLIQGLGVGGFLVLMSPTFSDVIDESIVRTKERNEGLFSGFRFFVANFSRVLMSIMLTVVHILTGFNEGSDTQLPSAIIGIQLHTGFIPAIFMLVGVLLFWKFYDITPEKAKEIKEQLIEYNL